MNIHYSIHYCICFILYFVLFIIFIPPESKWLWADQNILKHYENYIIVNNRQQNQTRTKKKKNKTAYLVNHPTNNTHQQMESQPSPLKTWENNQVCMALWSTSRMGAIWISWRTSFRRASTVIGNRIGGINSSGMLSPQTSGRYGRIGFQILFLK